MAQDKSLIHPTNRLKMGFEIYDLVRKEVGDPQHLFPFGDIIAIDRLGNLNYDSLYDNTLTDNTHKR